MSEIGIDSERNQRLARIFVGDGRVLPFPSHHPRRPEPAIRRRPNGSRRKAEQPPRHESFAFSKS